ncbi:NAD(P)/FAD-dependent oxidoreductase [Erythrobacter sp. SN021]|uniref:NAD(P)/FAD-dependent oxidoreductase n=1 Tax=Erythrobacter sp. SN021 TaxID=2912574 RepID=UPI001F3323F8|nr:NAD(P)/FAD-dependent oxidoreductase [Erythrobacter sp. SN021]MCF8882057.1 NAD(P)/FAD-dependent oxidoreductase [Erythrobacter sp. SN021]
MTDTSPVTVVGAGPAGLSAAIVLARGGREVIVHEWHSQLGSRFHADYQGLENWSTTTDVLLDFQRAGIEPEFLAHPVKKGYGFDAEGTRHELSSDRPLFYLVERGGGPESLEQGLLKQAQSLGVEVRFDSRVETVTGSAILAAGPRRADIIASGFVFDTDMADGAFIVFDDDLAPSGYAYLLVHRGRGTVASCLFSDFKRQKLYVERTCAFFANTADLKMMNPRPFGGFGNLRFPHTGLQGGHPVIGEHAGFQDALAGFGLRYSVLSGVLAARSLLEGRDYQALWRGNLLRGMKASIVNRFLFNTVGRRGRGFVTRKLLGGDTVRFLHSLYSPSLLHHALYPIARHRFRASLRDPSCDHQDCSCVWCEHGLGDNHENH